MHNTNDSFGLIRPASTSRFAAATVTPPAVSAKIPSVSANNRIPATTSSSSGFSANPPVFFIVPIE